MFTANLSQQRLLAVLKKLNEAGLTLNKEKCVFNATSIKFLGQLVDNTGVKADPDKILAIQGLKPPTNVSELRRFLGMVNQLSKFAPNLADETKPLRELLSARNHWKWDAPQEQAFDKLKALLSSSEVLALYDPSLESTVSADASAYGLGAVLRQRQTDGKLRPVAYISRALTPTEQRYAQIEKEALAITWACERFQDYLIGIHFNVETDHKPLVPLLSTKSLDEMPLRIQRFRLRLMRYHYSISHVAGKELCTADTLSRAPVDIPDSQSQKLQQDVTAYVESVIDHLPATEKRLKEIQKEQEEDPACKQVKSFCQNGWPENAKLEKLLKPYAAVKFELSIVGGLLLKGNRIVIPQKLRTDMIEKLHAGHQGLSKCRRRAQHSVWWPNIGKALKEKVFNCPICCQHRLAPTEPLIPSELPDRPWQKVATDLFEFQKSQYLLVIDYYSRFIEIAKLSTTTSTNVITHLKSIFSRHGVPETVRSDNGPQYSSEQFAEFANQYGFSHITSSPKYPQSNGAAERAVRTIKDLLKKNKTHNGDMYMAMLAYRSTPLENGLSPAELLMGRKLRTSVPVEPKQLNPKVPNQSQLRQKEHQQREKQRLNFNKRHRAVISKPLKKGDNVWLPEMEKKGTVIKQKGTRSYLV